MTLSDHYRLHLVDLKGFGLSSKPDDDAYSADDQAEIMRTFIERIDLHNLILLGHSYGGAVALLTYLRLKANNQQDRIDALVLIDAAAYLQGFPFFVSIPRSPIINSIVLNLIPARWQAEFTLKRIFYDPSKVEAERVERYARFYDLPGSHNALIKSAEQIVPQNMDSITKQISEIKKPALIIWGQNDPVVPLEHAYKLHKDIGGSRLEIIPYCGHVPHEEKPVETARILLDFVI